MAIKYLDVGTIPAIALGVLVATLAAMVIGALIVKRRGVYFAMVTIAFGQVFYFLAFRWNSVTGGDDGLTGWPVCRSISASPGSTSSATTRRSTISRWPSSPLCVGAMAALLASPFGRTLIAIRENERRARFLGVPIEFHIWLSFVISCLFVSVAGGLYALLNNFTDPRALRFDLSGNLVIMAVLGGMRSFWGPLIGAAIFVALQDYVSSHTENWMSVIGLVFVLVVRFFPRGVLGMLRKTAEGMTLLQVKRRLEALWQPRRDRRRVAVDRAGRIACDHRAERRGQDDLFQSRQRPLCADSGRDPCSTDATSPRLLPNGGLRGGWRARFRSPKSFPSSRSRDNIRVAVEIAAGYRLKPWLGRAARAKIEERVSELLAMGGLAEKSDVARRRAVARRPAGGGNHDVARPAPAPADARRADRGHGRPGDL